METDEIIDENKANNLSKKYDIPEGLTKTQRKNKRKLLREKKKKTMPPEDMNAKKKPNAIEDPHQNERLEVIKNIEKSLAELQSPTEASKLDDYKRHLSIIDNLISELDEANQKLNLEVEKFANRNINFTQLSKHYESLCEELEEEDDEIINLRKQLVSFLTYRNGRKMEVEFARLRKKLENRKQAVLHERNQVSQNKRLNKLVEKVRAALLRKDGTLPVNSLVTPSTLVTQKISLSSTLLSEILPPSNILQIMRIRHGVIFDNVGPNSTYITISGLKEDVDHLVHFFQNGDFTGKYSLTADSKLIPSIIGVHGSNIHKIEQKYNCYIRIYDNTLRIIGLPDDAYNALNDLKKGVEEKQHETTIKEVIQFSHPAIPQALLSKFLPYIRNIESSHNIRIRIVLNDSYAQIIGKHKYIKDGIKAFQDFINSLKIIEIKSNNPVAIQRLFEKFSKGNTSTYHYAYTQQFRRMILAADKTAFVRYNDSIVIISQNEAPSNYVESIEQLLTNLSYEPVQYHLPKDTSFVFTYKVLSNIENETNTTIQRIPLSNNQSTLEIIGDLQSQLKAKEALDNILETKAIVYVLNLQDPHIYNQSEKLKSKLRFIESNYSIRVSFENNSIKFIGSQTNIDKAKAELQQFMMKLSNSEPEDKFANSKKKSLKPPQPVSPKVEVNENKKTDESLYLDAIINDNSFPSIIEGASLQKDKKPAYKYIKASS